MNSDSEVYCTYNDKHQLHSYCGSPSYVHFDFRNQNGSFKQWHKNGVLHRDTDHGPAYLSADIAIYYKKGQIHNDPQYPAMIKRFDNHYKLDYFTNGQNIKSEVINTDPGTKTISLMQMFFSEEDHDGDDNPVGKCIYNHFNGRQVIENHPPRTETSAKESYIVMGFFAVMLFVAFMMDYFVINGTTEQ